MKNNFVSKVAKGPKFSQFLSVNIFVGHLSIKNL